MSALPAVAGYQPPAPTRAPTVLPARPEPLRFNPAETAVIVVDMQNAYRPRAYDTRLGTLELKIPKLRKDSYRPAFLEPRRTTEQALVAVIQETWIKGVSTRKVDDPVQAAAWSIGASRASGWSSRTRTRA